MYNLMIMSGPISMVINFNDLSVAVSKQGTLNKSGYRTLLTKLQFFDEVSDDDMLESISSATKALTDK